MRKFNASKRRVRSKTQDSDGSKPPKSSPSIYHKNNNDNNKKKNLSFFSSIKKNVFSGWFSSSSSSSSSHNAMTTSPFMKIKLSKAVLPMFGVLAFLQAIRIMSSTIVLPPDSNTMQSSHRWHNQGIRRCVVLAMVSQPDEQDVRDWHREQHRRFQRERPDLADPKFDLRFLIPSLDAPKKTQDAIRKEKTQHNDIYPLTRTKSIITTTTTTTTTTPQSLNYVPPQRDMFGDYNFTARTDFELMRLTRPLLNDPQCTASFLVRAESHYVVSHPNLVEVIMSLPPFMAYFGTILTDFPTPHREDRVRGNFAHSFFPRFAYGGFYGLSYDVVEQLLLPTTERTVHRDPVADELPRVETPPDAIPQPQPTLMDMDFPWHDRAIGLALERSHAIVKNQFYLNGVYHLCSTTHIDCRDFPRYVAFAVANEDFGQNKRSILERTRIKLEQCSILHIPSPEEQTSSSSELQATHFKVDRYYVNLDTKRVLSHSCTVLSNKGKRVVQELETDTPVATKHMSEDDSCAEELYLLDNPDAAAAVEAGVFKSGRDHYVKEGWKFGGNNFFCPDYCQDRNVVDCLEECDKESFYLQHYPDIKGVVDAGVLQSGFQHYQMSGHQEERAYNCFKKYQDDGIGEFDDCLTIWRKFITNTEEVVKTWPIHGVPNNLPPDQCKALMLIDGKGGTWMDFTLRVHRRYLGPDWEFYLIAPPSLTKEWRPRYEGPMVNVVDIPEQFGNLSDYPREVNLLYRSHWLWNETLKCEYILHTHTDVFMFRPGAEDFMGYSYAGAPVEPETYQIKEWRYLCIKTTRCGGGGGLSVRRKSYTLRALEFCKIPFGDPYSEDMWYVACMQSFGDQAFMPHPLVANRFSLGNRCDVDNPIGMHHTWIFCRASTCAHAIAGSMLYRDLYGDDHTPTHACPEGEFVYHHLYQDDYKSSGVTSQTPGWDHWSTIGKNQGRFYPCFDPLTTKQ